MLSAISADVGTLFIERAKRYVKFEVEVESLLESQDVESYGFVLLVEVAIGKPIPSSLSRTTKKILSRLPSWTKAFEDSLDSATPDNQQPNTVAGKFINALVNDFPDNFDKQVNLFELDRYINTADENQISWIYVISDVPSSFISITGDGITLGRVESISDLYDSLETDYTYYYNAFDREIFTLKLHASVLIDGVARDSIPVLKWNWFDEFGARVGLERLYLEDNSNFKKRILDVYINKPGTTKEQIQKTLRRELDIWAAYDATPDSNYVGATPEIIEISDIESSTPYFDLSGKPTESFRKFVRDLNEKYPVNWGYVKWDNGFWDYAGQDQAGVGRIPAVYDDSVALGSYYQPGVGDFDDAKIIVSESDTSSVDFEVKLKALGSYISGYDDFYSPVLVNYQHYGSYHIDYYDNEASTVNFKYTVTNASDSKQYYTESFYYPRNSYAPNHSASPEYKLVSIFDQDGYSYPQYTFKEVGTNQLYVDQSATPSTSRYNIFNSSGAKIETVSPSVNNLYNVKFAGKTNKISTTGIAIQLDDSEYALNAYNIQISSNIYNKKTKNSYTDKINNSIIINSNNNQDEPLVIDIDKDFMHKTVVFESGATPDYMHIDIVQPIGYTEYLDNVYFSEDYSGYGGISKDPNTDAFYLVPSSPNLNIRYVGSNFSTPNLHDHFISQDSSTVNYYFVSAKYPYGSTPDTIQVFTNESNRVLYPYQTVVWDSFEEHSTPLDYQTINKRGIVRSSSVNNDQSYNNTSELVGKYNISYDTFGIDQENYFIEKIEVFNDTEGVEIFLDKEFVETQDGFYSNLIREFNDGSIDEVAVNARYLGKYNSYLTSGWYDQLLEQNYIYSNPITENYTSGGFEIVLDQVARQGAPIIVNVDCATPYQAREVAFYNEATPTMPSLTNVEVLYANKGNSLYLGYEDVYNVNVIDLVTGYQVAANLSSNTNEIEVFSTSTPSVYNRPYQATYNVSNSFIVDNDFYDQTNDLYKTKLYFESTPAGEYEYQIIYESSINGMSTPISLDINPMKIWDQEGFIYLSHEDYNFDTAIVNLKPGYILDDGKDYMVITINSLDVNGNSKPYQTFQLSSEILAFTEEYVTTDINGFAYARAIYIGVKPSMSVYGGITVTGLSGSSPYAHPNSNSQSFSKTFNFDIITNNFTTFETKAIADKQVVEADGVSQIFVYGNVKNSSTPSSESIVYWRKGRSLYDIFEATPYGNYVLTDTKGNFTLGPFTAQDTNNPGIWLVAVETEHAATPSMNPETKSGDIVYWAEKYDNLKYSYGDTVFYNPNVLYNNTIGMMPTPNFTVSYYDASTPIVYTSTPNWLPPKWYPIERFTQYQMGLLGSTPYQVDSYVDLMKDYEEE